VLVVTRKVGQRIVIEGVGTVEIVDVDRARGRVSVGVDAPAHRVDREEVSIARAEAQEPTP
jgi:sRNA-binding carbon storage regulator CsrA